MRAVVFGYGTVCCSALAELLRQGHEVAAVVTQPDSPEDAGWFESVVEFAAGAGLVSHTPADPNTDEFVATIAALQPEVLFSFYYRQMLKAPLLALASRGALNLHGSYLPAYRGRCPVNWAVLEGQAATGVTLHYMVEKPDAGDLVAQRRILIGLEDTWYDIYLQVATEGRALLAEVLPLLAAGEAPRRPQDLAAGFYRGGRKPADGRFEWDWPALRIHNLVRGVTHPYPGAFVGPEGRELLVWKSLPSDQQAPAVAPGRVAALTDRGPLVATGNGLLLLLEVQAGEGEVPGREFARERNLAVGDPIC